LFLAREGIGSLIVERETFPRYHVGESMTGECGAILRGLGFEPQMLARRHPMKKGVNVYGPGGKRPWFVGVAGRDEQGRLFDQFTWQVRRSDFDKMMLDEALARGAMVFRGRALRPLRGDDGGVRGVRVRAADRGEVDIEADLVLDCSGQATFLANAGVTGPKYLGSYDKQIAIFSQVVGAIRDDGPSRTEDKDNTLILYRSKFNWAWFIPLDSEVVSVGVVVPAAYFLGKRESKRDFLVRELHELNPELTRRIPEIKLVEDVHVIPNYSYQVRGFCGRGYVCLGDAHRFIDPIFSFGLYVAVKEAQLVAPAVARYLAGEGRDAANPFAGHQLYCERGIDVLEDMIDLFWEQPLLFATFVHRSQAPAPWRPPSWLAERLDGVSDTPVGPPARVVGREEIIDFFAGRIYGDPAAAAAAPMRRMLKRQRTYEDDGLYSVPIGSRYHPERAPLWQATETVETTEAWMGSR
jgi:flavin-dependent dehydrogenase